MNQRQEETLYPKIITLITALLLIFIGYMFTGLLHTCPAWAGEIQSVTGDEMQTDTGFLISMSPSTAAQEPIVLETSPNVAKESTHLDNRDVPDLIFTFNDVDSEGETGFVVVKHPFVGYAQALNGDSIKVGATVRYEVTYSRADELWNIGTDKAQLKIHASMGLAVGQFNVARTRATYSFFDAQTEQPMSFGTGSLFYSLSSLNGTPLTEYVEVPTESFEKALFKQSGNIAVETRGANTVFYGSTNHPDDPGWNETYDYCGNPYSNNNTVMIYPKDGIIDFWVGDRAPGDSIMWWQISSAPIAHTPPNPPVKTVNTENAHEGDTLSYSVVQQMGEYGVDVIVPYKSLSLVDHLPNNVTYTQGSARLSVDKSEPADITDTAGQAAYDPQTNTLTYTFNADYLKDTPLIGQSYTLTFDCVITGSAAGVSSLENKAYSYFNDYELQGNKVDTLVNNAALSIEKTVSKEEWNVGDTVDYQVTVVNTAADSIANNVIVSDISLPEGLAVTDISSIEVQGVGETVSCPVQVDGALTTEEKNNTYRIEPEGTGWNLHIDYLAANAPVTITYHAQATEQVAGQAITNTATAVADNAPQVQDSADIVIKEDIPNKQGYEVTVYKSSDPISGSTIKPESTITYTLEARNTGTDPAPFTFIRDYIPQGTTYVEGSVNQEGCYVSQGNYVEWIIENIDPDTSQKVAYQVTVDAQPPALIPNTALYGSAETTPGIPGSIDNDPPTPTNEVMHTTDTDIKTPALLDLEKTSNPEPGSTVLAGDTIKYTLTLRNNGEQSAVQPCIRDYIPQGTTYVDGSASNSGVFDETQNCITWTPETLDANETFEVGFSVVVQDDTQLTTISNQALFQDNWDGTKDPENSSNIVAHKLPADLLEPPTTQETTPSTPSAPTTPTTQPTPQQGSSGSISAGLAKTGDFIMKNIIAILCAITSIAAIAWWRKRVEMKKTGYTRYGKTN